MNFMEIDDQMTLPSMLVTLFKFDSTATP